MLLGLVVVVLANMGAGLVNGVVIVRGVVILGGLAAAPVGGGAKVGVSLALGGGGASLGPVGDAGGCMVVG